MRDDDTSLSSFLHNLTVSLFAYAQHISWEYTYSSSLFFFFHTLNSNTLLMSERQSDWEVGGGKKKISLPSIICDFTKKQTKAEQSGFFIWELEPESEVVMKRQQTR